MLTRTSELATRALLFIALNGDGEPLSPRQISASLDCSPSYLAKVLGLLVRAGILRSIRGVNGGVLLARAPAEINLLQICEACQGILIANYCESIEDHGEQVCSYHQAMRELHRVTVETLSKWTLRDLMTCPMRPETGDRRSPCKMLFEA